MSRNPFRLSVLAISVLSLQALPVVAGSVAGRIVDAKGMPLSGARVAWTRALSEEETLVAETEEGEAELLGETRTGADGAFRIALEKSGVSVSIRIQPAGLPEARLEGPYGSEETVALEVLRFPEPARRRGRVVDAAGRGVAGARVSVLSFGEGPAGETFRAEGRTGTDGAFEIAAAPQGSRTVSVRAAGFVPLQRYTFRSEASETFVVRAGGTVAGAVLDPGGRPASGAIVVCGEVAARADSNGLFRLSGVAAGSRPVRALWKDEFAARREVRVAAGAEAGATLRLAKAAAIAGTVIDEATRRPVAGVRISLSESADSELSGRRTRTDAKGRFRAAGLPPGRYSVETAAEDYLPSEIPGVVAAVPAGPALSIALRREAALSGRVVDESGKPVSGARVALPREGGMRRMARAFRRAAFRAPDAVTGADGTFTLRRLVPASNVSVEATKADYAPSRKTGLRLRGGETLGGVTLVLRAGLVVRGSVVDAEGKPVAGAEIQAQRTEAGGPRRVMFFRAGEEAGKPDAVTAPDGGFSVSGLEAGRYQVSASREGYVQKVPATADVAAGRENRLAPIVLDTGVAIAGKVKGTGGEPVAGARVFAIAEAGRPLETETGADGGFRITGLTAGRPVRFFITADGYAQRQSSATPPAADVVVTLDTNGTVRGRVEDAMRQSPVTDFSISRGEAPAGGGGGMVMRMYTGDEGRSFHAEDGTFELSNVPPGRWVIRAEAPGYRAAEVSGIEVAAGETKEGVVLSMKRGGSISGRVVEASRGAAVPNASVSWTEAGGSEAGPMFVGNGPRRETAADADGRFSFDALPEGKITLSASHPDYLEASMDVDPDRQETVEIALGSGGQISGTVVGSDGRTPASGARVSLEALGEAAGGRWGGDAATAGGDGAFLFEHLRAGKYELAAQGNAGTSAPKEIVLADGQRADGVVLQTTGGTLLRGSVAGLPAGELAGVRIFASGSSYFDSTATDAEGLFTLPDVPAGVIRLNASTSFLAGRSTQKTVEIPAGTAELPVEIAFEGAARLSGQVSRAGKPLSGLFVSASPDPPTGAARASGQTDESGRYALEGLADGTYRLMVMGQNVSFTKSVAVSGDSEEDVAIPGSSLSGVVTSEGTGEPLEGASVQAETGSETQAFAVKQAVSDSNGAWSIGDVEPGSYRVTARKAGYRLETRAVTVGSEPAGADFALVKGSGLTVRVSDGQTGLPLSSVQVLAFGAGGTVAFQGTVSLDGSGSGEVPSLADGAYALYVFSDGYAPRSLPSVGVPAPPLSLALTPGGRVHARSESFVTGRLVDASGAVVLLTPFRLDGAVTVSPPVTLWEHLPPGSYRFVAATSGGKPYAFSVAEGQTTELELK